MCVEVDLDLLRKNIVAFVLALKIERTIKIRITSSVSFSEKIKNYCVLIFRLQIENYQTQNHPKTVIDCQELKEKTLYTARQHI